MSDTLQFVARLGGRLLSQDQDKLKCVGHLREFFATFAVNSRRSGKQPADLRIMLP